jgi:cytidylate kinase
MAAVRIMAVEREYGSGAAAISKALAAKLGWKLWDADLTTRIAGRLNCEPKAVEQREERVDSVFYRLIKAFMRGSVEPRTDAAVELLDAENLVILFEKVIDEIASEGNAIIIGRGASWFLRDRADVFSIFLYASYEEKLRRTMQAGISRKEAEELLQTVDQERAAFIRKYYGLEWPHRPVYNLMINTKAGDDAVVRIVLDQIERSGTRVTGRGGTSSS